LKPERWGSPLVQEKYQEEMPATETSILYNNNNNNNNNYYYYDYYYYYYYSVSLNVKMQNVCRGKCIVRKTYNNHWIAVTIYTLENFSGIQL
jgi:hypothetical protein